MSTLPSRPGQDDRVFCALLAFAAFACVLLFSALTSAVWEDYYITFRSSQNLVDGNGLVYHPGDRLHTFTSPLGVLLPAACYAITRGFESALWLFRVISAAALGGAAWLVARALLAQGWSRAGCFLAVLLGLLTLKNIEFASNGMESGFLTFFALLAFTELLRPEGPRVRRLALAFAGLMWTRPDAFVIAGALAAGALIFSPPERRAALWRRGFAAASLGVALYLPWLVFAWVYYGTPIPHTITAKAAITPAGLSLKHLLLTPLRCLATNGVPTEGFAPDYFTIQQWGPDWHNIWGVIARVAAFAWILPRLPRAARIASFALLVGDIYLSQVQPFPWYYAPWTALGGVALAGFCAAGWKQSWPAARVGAAAAALCGAVVLGAGAVTAAKRQTLVEYPVRAAIGRWLKENARQGDTVFLEPSGYIGYFATSHVRLTDYPGLTSRESANALKSGAGTFAQLIARLHPDWLVLRPHEILDPQLVAAGELQANYVHRARFSTVAEIQAERFLPGREWMLYDGEFHIYERKRSMAATP